MSQPITIRIDGASDGGSNEDERYGLEDTAASSTTRLNESGDDEGQQSSGGGGGFLAKPGGRRQSFSNLSMLMMRGVNGASGGDDDELDRMSFHMALVEPRSGMDGELLEFMYAREEHHQEETEETDADQGSAFPTVVSGRYPSRYRGYPADAPLTTGPGQQDDEELSTSDAPSGKLNDLPTTGRMNGSSSTGVSLPPSGKKGDSGSGAKESGEESGKTPSPRKPSPLVSANILSRFSYSWMGPLFQVGWRKTLEENDLFDLPPEDETVNLTNRLLAAWDYEKTHCKPTKKPSLARAFYKCFWREIWLAGIWAAIEAAFQIAQPIFLGFLVNFIADPTQSDTNGYLYALGLILTSFFFGGMHHVYFFSTMRLGMQMRVAAIGAVYRKTLTLSQVALGATTTGQIVNLISSDVQRFDATLPFVHSLWLGPITCGVILWLTWREVGPSALTGILSILFLLVPIQAFSAKVFAKLRRKTAQLTDERVKVMNEVISGIRVMKMYAWEPAFRAVVAKLRGLEMKQIKKASYMRALNMAFFFCSPTVIGFLTFGTYELAGGNITSANVFVTISLLAVVRLNMTLFFPVALQGLSESKVSVSRLQDYLEMNEVGEQNALLQRLLQMQSASSLPSPATNGDGYSKLPAYASNGSIHRGMKGRAQSTLSIGYSLADLPVGKPYEQVMEEFSHEPAFLHVDHIICSWDETHVSIKREKVLKERQRQQALAEKKARRRSSSKVLAKTNGDQSGHPQSPSPSTPATPDSTSVDESRVTLDDVSFHVSPGKLLAVVGPVASGKSSLLMALLNELPTVAGTVTVKGRIAYAAQEAWIVSGTIRENILFGQPMHQERYNAVIEACALSKDLTLFDSGDLTEIGERGITLSGGQRARISLARAVYFDADIYLLDDPLSAVDAHVGRHLFEKCVNGILRNKPRILVTHQLQFLQGADEILILKGGRVADIGTFAELVAKGNDFIISEAAPQESADDRAKREKDESAAKAKALVPSEKPSLAAPSSDAKAAPEKSGEAKPPMQRQATQVISKESRGVGNIGWTVYWDLFKSAGPKSLFVVLVIICFISQGTVIGADYYLSYWSNIAIANRSLGENLGIYTALVLCAVIIAGVRSVYFFYIILSASKNLHDRMFGKVIRSPMWFFDSNPVGRVLNRFSKDVGFIDELLPVTFYDCVQSLLAVIGSVLLVSVLNPWVFIIAVPLFVVFFFFRRYYMASSREIKRMEGITRSPVYTHFSATLQGLPTIRGYNVEKRFLHEYESRQDAHNRTWMMFLTSARWLGFRLDLFCFLFIAFTAFASVWSRNSLNPGLVGLTLAYALQMTGIFQWCIRQTAEVESLMTSVERVVEYTKLEEEPPAVIEDNRPPQQWPQSGALTMDKMTMYYKNGVQPVLNQISCHIEGGEKIGIVGRTGAGKSSLMQALFRLTEIADGAVFIDKLNTSTIGLADLRSKISVIPQEPVLFSGTLRHNLDPFHEHTDDELWGVLDHVQLKAAVSEWSGKLDGVIAESGSNLSVGQRQLLCLARAMLRHNKILVMDEATASVDLETDELIQKTIRVDFKDCTVLTIAHRLNTVMDSDKIMVMDKGRLVEFEEPYILLTDPAFEKSIFRSLVEETGKANFNLVLQAAHAKHLERKDRRERAGAVVARVSARGSEAVQIDLLEA